MQVQDNAQVLADGLVDGPLNADAVAAATLQFATESLLGEQMRISDVDLSPLLDVQQRCIAAWLKERNAPASDLQAALATLRRTLPMAAQALN